MNENEHKRQQNPDGSGQPPYAIVYWLLHASDVAKTNESGGPTKLCDLIVKFLTDDDAFRDWAKLLPEYQTSHRGHCTYYNCTLARPLHIAASYGLFRVAERLLAGEAGDATKKKDFAADLHYDTQRYCGGTPLRWAVRNGHEAVARLLIDRGADVSAAESDGKTPLHWALENGYEAVARLLRDRGATEEQLTAATAPPSTL